MTTKAPAEVQKAPEDLKVKQIYDIVEELADVIPVTNERYRLGFCLNLLSEGKIENLLDAIDQAKPDSSTKDFPELEKILSDKLKNKNLI